MILEHYLRENCLSPYKFTLQIAPHKRFVQRLFNEVVLYCTQLVIRILKLVGI